MRILHLNQYGDLRGGAEAYIAEVAAALEERGHASHLVFLTAGPGDLLPASTAAPLADWPAPIEGARLAIEQLLRAFQPDVAYVHAVYHPDLIEWLGNTLPTVAYVHSPYPVCPGNGQYLRTSGRACPHSAGLLCLVNAQTEHCCWGRNPLKHIRLLQRSRRFVQVLERLNVVLVAGAYMKGLLERGGVQEERLAVLPPAMLPGTLPADDGGEELSRTVLYAGRLTEEKGLRSLIAGLATVEGDWQLLVAGDGDDRPACEALASQLGVTERVCFLGWISDEELSKCFQRATCIAIPSLWPEPFGRVGSQAFYNARPVVAYASGGIPDWLRHEEFGYLVPAGDSAQLGQSIRRLLDSPSLSRAMGQKARAYALAAWDRREHVDNLMGHFGRAVQAFPARLRAA